MSTVIMMIVQRTPLNEPTRLIFLVAFYIIQWLLNNMPTSGRLFFGFQWILLYKLAENILRCLINPVVSLQGRLLSGIWFKALPATSLSVLIIQELIKRCLLQAQKWLVGLLLIIRLPLCIKSFVSFQANSNSNNHNSPHDQQQHHHHHQQQRSNNNHANNGSSFHRFKNHRSSNHHNNPKYYNNKPRMSSGELCDVKTPQPIQRQNFPPFNFNFAPPQISSSSSSLPSPSTPDDEKDSVFN